MNQVNNQSQPSPLALAIEQLAKSLTPAILLPQNPHTELLYAATAMYLAMTKNAKTPALACSTKVNAPIFAVEKITSTLGGMSENLIISFPYQDGSIDKIDYRISDGMFNLIVVPRQGFAQVRQEDVTFSTTGNQPDLIITLGVPSLDALGPLYTQNQQLIDSTPIVNIDRDSRNVQFGTHNIIDRYASSMSELVFQTLRAMEVQIDPESATNMHAGIMLATNNLTSPETSPLTYEIIGALLRLGALKNPQQLLQMHQQRGAAPASTRRQPQQYAPAQQAATQQSRPQGQPPARQRAAAYAQPTTQTQSSQQTSPQRPQSQAVGQSRPNTIQRPQPRPQPEADILSPVKQPRTWYDNLPGAADAASTRDEEGTAEASSSFDETGSPEADDNQVRDQEQAQDWLKPKIFNKTGSGIA
jgi:hypothetical protein